MKRKWLGFLASIVLLSACAAFSPNDTDTGNEEIDSGTEDPAGSDETIRNKALA